MSQACSLLSPFEEDISGYAAAAGSAIELWLTKVEDYLQTHTVEEVRQLAADRQMEFAAAAYQGGILVSQGEQRREAWQQLEQRLDLCAALGVPTLIVVPDFLGPFDHLDVERAQVSLQQAGQAAARRGVRIAVEFQAKNTFLNNLETMASFVQSVGEPNVGICFDVFQYYLGPSKPEDLRALTRENLFHVQLCDLADTPREMAADADRILPGDGDFNLPLLIDHFRQIGYDGFVSLELFNPTFWRVPARQIGEVGLTSLRMALGLNRRRPEAGG